MPPDGSLNPALPNSCNTAELPPCSCPLRWDGSLNPLLCLPLTAQRKCLHVHILFVGMPPYGSLNSCADYLLQYSRTAVHVHVLFVGMAVQTPYSAYPLQYSRTASMFSSFRWQFKSLLCPSLTVQLHSRPCLCSLRWDATGGGLNPYSAYLLQYS